MLHNAWVTYRTQFADNVIPGKKMTEGIATAHALTPIQNGACTLDTAQLAEHNIQKSPVIHLD